MNIKVLLFACGLFVGALSIATPQESASVYKADNSSVKQPASKQPSSEIKTFTPKPVAIRTA